MSNTKKLALGGLITALASFLMIISNIIPFGIYVFSAFAGIIIYVLGMTCGNSYAVSSYVAVAFVSFILCADKEVVLCFIFLLGYYPILKEKIDNIKYKVLRYILKFIIFNISLVIIYLLLAFVFAISKEQTQIFGINVPMVFWVTLNIEFVMYDYILSAWVKKYKSNILKIIGKIFK